MSIGRHLPSTVTDEPFRSTDTVRPAIATW
jgi:hypothetical protein